MKLKHKVILATTAASFMLTGVAFAGGVTYKDGDKYVKLGGRVQVQYHATSPDGGGGDDEMFFRRFRPYIEGSTHAGWKGKFQFDLGKASAENEVAVKDAYMQYKGFDGIKITIGNAKTPFSRENLTSSKKQQLVERTFVGDHNYGVTDRALGVHVAGHAMDKKLTWAASLAQADIDPSAKKIDFDTPVNKNADFNEGWLIGGRVDFHPLGYLKMSQGDFKGESKATISLAGYNWANDGDVDGGAHDLDTVTGFEVSGAVRGMGISIDAEYNLVTADAVDTTLTSGLYVNGTTDLTTFAIEGGYMVVPKTIELVAGYENMDADGFTDAWTRTSVGANWYIEKHDIKLQATYRIGSNLKGDPTKDEDELFIQAQYVF